MQENIVPTKFTRLQNPMDLYMYRKGSWHDQSVFAIYFLRQMGIDAKALFLIETNLMMQAGKTYSLVYYKMNGKYYWFKHGHEDKSGVSEYSSMEAIIKEFKSIHRSGAWGKYKLYPNLQVSAFMYQIGDDLQMLVNRMFKPI